MVNLQRFPAREVETPSAQGSHAGTEKIAAIVPCYRVREQILTVLEKIGHEVAAIYVVDDACPESTGEFVEAAVHDPRVKVLYHAKNRGVGGAVLTGYAAALADGATICVKLDGDGQMDPAFLRVLVGPIVPG